MAKLTVFAARLTCLSLRQPRSPGFYIYLLRFLLGDLRRFVQQAFAS